MLTSVPTLFTEILFIKENTVIMPLADEHIVEYYFENKGSVDCFISGIQLQPFENIRIQSSSFAFDKTTYRLIFEDTTGLKNLLIIKRRFINFIKI